MKNKPDDYLLIGEDLPRRTPIALCVACYPTEWDARYIYQGNSLCMAHFEELKEKEPR